MVDAKNEADTALHTTEKSLAEYKDKLGQADIDEITQEISALREMIADASTELAALKDQTEKVKNAAMKIGKAMYGQNQETENKEEPEKQDEKQEKDEKKDEKKN